MNCSLLKSDWLITLNAISVGTKNVSNHRETSLSKNDQVIDIPLKHCNYIHICYMQ